MVPILEAVLAQKLIKVKSPEVQVEVLLNCTHGNRLSFLNSYQAEAEKILRDRKKQPETARLLHTWILAALRSKTFADNYLLGWGKLLLKKQSHRDLEKIEDNLRTAGRNVIDYWLRLKEEIEKSQTGFLKKMIDGLFGRR